MRQTPFGVWNVDGRRARRGFRLAAMRQTPFGVWNVRTLIARSRRHRAAMRQTPFGVWNWRSIRGLWTAMAGCNKADAFRRLELARSARDQTVVAEAAMRQTPFGVWNVRTLIARSRRHRAAMRQTPFGVWNVGRAHALIARRLRCNEADAFRRLERGDAKGGRAEAVAAMRQTPFGVWNGTWYRASVSARHELQ